MATTILGTFPVLNYTKSQTDEYGFDYVSYQYTIKTSTLDNYNIKKDDVFEGIETWRGVSWTKTPNPQSLYVVDTVETKNSPGDLTQLMVNTVGSKNTSNPPRVCIISGGPLIFGLSGTFPSGQIQGYGVDGVGQSVEVKFLATGGIAGQQSILTTYFGAAMPASIGGSSLPAPARGPGGFNNDYVVPGNDLMGAYIVRGTFGDYYGFVCKTVLTEKRGSLLLVTLVFSEAGYADYWPNPVSAQSQTSINIYRFPIVG